MTSTDPITMPAQPSDPALFEPLSLDENTILNAHLTSGWYKQGAVYPVLSAPWQETSGLLDDLHAARRANFEASQAARQQAVVLGPCPAAAPPAPEPEAGL
jgi:hypothetical protein